MQRLLYQNDLQVIYAANTMVPTLDNCDQRIVTDTRLLAQSFCTLMFGGGPMNGFVMVIMTVLIATYYTAQSGWFILTCWYVRFSPLCCFCSADIVTDALRAALSLPMHSQLHNLHLVWAHSWMMRLQLCIHHPRHDRHPLHDAALNFAHLPS